MFIEDVDDVVVGVEELVEGIADVVEDVVVGVEELVEGIANVVEDVVVDVEDVDFISPLPSFIFLGLIVFFFFLMLLILLLIFQLIQFDYYNYCLNIHV